MFSICSHLRRAARCVLYYNTILARGPAGRVPVASPRAAGAPGGIEPAFAPVKRIAVLSLAGRDFALLLHLHRPRGYRSPVEPSIKGETLALPSEHPINQGLEICLSTWTDPCPNVWPFDCQVRGVLLLPVRQGGEFGSLPNHTPLIPCWTPTKQKNRFPRARRYGRSFSSH